LRVTADDHRGTRTSPSARRRDHPAIISEPPTSDQRINFRLQLDPDAAQPFLTPVPVAAHPLAPDERDRVGGAASVVSVMMCPYYTAGVYKGTSQRRWPTARAREKRPAGRGGGQLRNQRTGSVEFPTHGGVACAGRAGLYGWVTVSLAPPYDAARRAEAWSPLRPLIVADKTDRLWPHTCRSQEESGSAQLGGLRAFAIGVVVAALAPIPDVRT
jgi:hypothetical protein